LFATQIYSRRKKQLNVRIAIHTTRIVSVNLVLRHAKHYMYVIPVKSRLIILNVTKKLLLII